MRNPSQSRVNRRTMRLLGIIVLVFLIAINVAAFFHARSMTSFAAAGERTGRPEDLSLLQQVGVLFTGVRLTRPANETTPDNYLLSYLVDTIASGKSTQLELWLMDWPEPHGVVALFHGYGASKEIMLQEAAALYAMGYTVCLPDFRGSGGSTGDYTTIGWEEADDVAAVARYLRQQYPDQCLWLYGQSMGGAAVLRAVSVEPGLADGLVIESVYDRLLTTVKHRFELMNLPPTPFAHLLVFWGGLRFGFNAFELNPAEYATKVNLPTLVMHGELDPRAKVDEARTVYDNLRGEKLFEVFEGIGHQSGLDADASRWRIVVSDFLGKNCPSPRENPQRLGQNAGEPVSAD